MRRCSGAEQRLKWKVEARAAGVFRELARLSSARRELAELLRAVAAFAAGGVRALTLTS
jgi:hypothetical protein